MQYFLSLTGHLYLNSSLDYESQHVYILTVQAKDSGAPSMSSTQTLTVEVLDVNDHPPVFQHHIYNTTVMENREPGEFIVTVTAIDLDSGRLPPLKTHDVTLTKFQFSFTLSIVKHNITSEILVGSQTVVEITTRWQYGYSQFP